MTRDSVRLFALIYGIAFTLVGVAAFIPGLVQQHDMGAGHNDLRVTGPGTGYLLGLFHVNLLHNLTHLIFGIWGLIAWRNGFGSSRVYGRGVAIIYALFAIMGLIPGLDTVFGLVPLHGHDVWLHVLLAAVAAVFGFSPVRAHDPMITGGPTTTGTSAMA